MSQPEKRREPKKSEAPPLPSPGLAAWLDINKPLLAIVGLCLVGAGVALYIANWSSDRAERQAGDELFRLFSELEEDEQLDPSDLEAFAAAHRSTSAAERALLLMGRSHFIDARYDEALQAFSRFQSLHPSSPLLFSAAYGEAASLEALGRLDEALAGYEKVRQNHPTEPVSSMAALASARILELKEEPARALEMYQEMDRPETYSGYSALALERKEGLLRRHPELEPAEEAAEEYPDQSGNGAPENAGEDGMDGTGSGPDQEEAPESGPGDADPGSGDAAGNAPEPETEGTPDSGTPGEDSGEESTDSAKDDVREAEADELPEGGSGAGLPTEDGEAGSEEPPQ